MILKSNTKHVTSKRFIGLAEGGDTSVEFEIGIPHGDKEVGFITQIFDSAGAPVAITSAVFDDATGILTVTATFSADDVITVFAWFYNPEA